MNGVLTLASFLAIEGRLTVKQLARAIRGKKSLICMDLGRSSLRMNPALAVKTCAAHGVLGVVIFTACLVYRVSLFTVALKISIRRCDLIVMVNEPSNAVALYLDSSTVLRIILTISCIYLMSA